MRLNKDQKYFLVVVTIFTAFILGMLLGSLITWRHVQFEQRSIRMEIEAIKHTTELVEQLDRSLTIYTEQLEGLLENLQTRR